MQKQKIDRMGVYVLMAHLVITVALIVAYVIFTILDKPVGTVETALFMVLAYWFGAMGSNAIRPNSQTQINQANEVKVNPPANEQQPPIGG